MSTISALSAKKALARSGHTGPVVRWLTQTELAYHLGVSHRAITNWTAAKLLPHYRVEGIVRYDLAAVRKALKRFMVKAETEAKS